jgi:hypothetical protein
VVPDKEYGKAATRCERSGECHRNAHLAGSVDLSPPTNKASNLLAHGINK